MSDESQPGANNTENNRLISSFNSKSDDEMLSLDKSDIDDDIYNDLALLSYIINEAIDLLQYAYSNVS